MEHHADDLATLVRTPFTETHVACLRELGEAVTYEPGETISAFGHPNKAFFYILEGEAATYDQVTGCRLGQTSLGPTQFIGEMSFLTGGTVQITVRAITTIKAIRVPRDAMLKALATLPEMSDIVVTVFAARRRWLIESERGGLSLIGAETDPAVRRIETFATRNRIAYQTHEIGSPKALELASRCKVPPGQAFVVVGERTALCDPSPRSVAHALGLDIAVKDGAQFDVVIVGSGPAGIAAAVYAGAEGLCALVVDENSIGGQAAASSRIENYMGFPTGISGADLCARGEIQALKFGTRFAVPRKVSSIAQQDGMLRVVLDDGGKVSTRSVIVASGVQYRRLSLDRLEHFEGMGVFYAATALEARHVRGGAAVIVGGGNSAGQAAMYLSERVQHVHLVVRGKSLSSSMSNYLLERVRSNEAITFHFCSEIAALNGETSLQSVVIRTEDKERELATKGLFVMIGAAPNTQWLDGLVDLDAKGFVVTDDAFATSCKGVFAVGDVRSGSTKRVASSAGEGSIVVSRVWHYLASNTDAARSPLGDRPVITA